MLSPEFLEEQKNKLLEEKKNIEAELSLVAERSTTDDEDYDAKREEIGRTKDEDAQEIISYETNLNLEKDLEGVLHKINQALEKIEKGEYGKCEQGDEIEIERLKVIPWATTCIDHS